VSPVFKGFPTARIPRIKPRIRYSSNELIMATAKSKTSQGAPAAALIENNHSDNPERESVFNAFRQWGYLEGDLDPLGFLPPRPTPELQI